MPCKLYGVNHILHSPFKKNKPSNMAYFLVGGRRIELPTFCVSSRRSPTELPAHYLTAKIIMHHRQLNVKVKINDGIIYKFFLVF